MAGMEARRSKREAGVRARAEAGRPEEGALITRNPRFRCPRTTRRAEIADTACRPMWGTLR